MSNGSVAYDGCVTPHGVMLTPYFIVVLSLLVVTLGGIAWNLAVLHWKRRKRRQTQARRISAIATPMSEVLLTPAHTPSSRATATVTTVHGPLPPDGDDESNECRVRVVLTESAALRDLRSEFIAGGDVDVRMQFATSQQRVMAEQDSLPSFRVVGEEVEQLDEQRRRWWVLRCTVEQWLQFPVHVGDAARLTMPDRKRRPPRAPSDLVLPSPGYCMFMGVLNLAHFFYICATLDWDYSQTPIRVFPYWRLLYEQLYVRVANSGLLLLPVTMLAGLERLGSEKAQPGRPASPKWVRSFLLVASGGSLIMLLPICLHSLPMVFIFPFLLLPLVFPYILMFAFCSRSSYGGDAPHRHAHAASATATATAAHTQQGGQSVHDGANVRLRSNLRYHLLRRLAYVIPLVTLQTAMHYAVILFTAPETMGPSTVDRDGSIWLKVIETEWRMRSSMCYFEDMHDTDQLIAFISWM